MNQSASGRDARAWLILITLAFVWGTSFILMKKAMMVFPPVQVAALRIFSAFLVLLPFVYNRYREIPPSSWKYIIAVGFLGNCIPAVLFTKAQTVISSSLAGILNALTPVFTLLVSFFVFRTSFTLYNFVGVLIGFAGCMGLMMMREGPSGQPSFQYSSYVVLATICYAFSVNIIRNKLHSIDSLIIAGWALFTVGLFSGVYLFTTDFTMRLLTYKGSFLSLGCVLLLGIFGTAVSLVYYNKLIKISGALFAASCTYLIPVFAMFWGLLDNERLTLFHLVGLSFILLGVYLVNKKA
jgi:drug/metabolite transporter (DMT)-like permease